MRVVMMGIANHQYAFVDVADMTNVSKIKLLGQESDRILSSVRKHVSSPSETHKGLCYWSWGPYR